MYNMQGYYRGKKNGVDRILVVAWGAVLFSIILFGRLFVLQIMDHDRYKTLAANQQVTTSVDPATRGNIYIKGDKSGTPSIIAENIMLYLLYVDPNPYNDKEMDDLVDTAYVAEKLTPLIYEHFCEGGEVQVRAGETCQDKVMDFSSDLTFEENKAKAMNVTTANNDNSQETADKQTAQEATPTYTEDQLKERIKKTIQLKASTREVQFVPLLYSKDEAILSQVRTLSLPGIYVGDGIVYGNPLEVMRKTNNSLDDRYKALGDIISSSYEDMDVNLARRLSRYAFLLRRMAPELTEKITQLRDRELLCPQLYLNPEKKEGLLDSNDEMCQHLKTAPDGKIVRNFFGIATREENWRNYPENSLAAQVVGFLNFEKDGNYGIEEEYDTQLRGNDGEIKIEADPMGRLIASNLKAEQIRERQDGVDVYLTIDRVVQQFVEDSLATMVKNTKANSGQVIIMNPFTGDIVAMAQYPSFNPNYYSDVYNLTETKSDPGRGIPMFIKDEHGELKDVNEYDRSSIPGNVTAYKYENKLGPGAYYNYSVQGTYEPGSIFKPLIMAAALDSGEVTPTTTYHDKGELKVDEYTIRNVSSQCLGTHDMINVLNFSCNIGMSFVAGRLGKALLYKYVTDFGFGERTGIDLPNEAKGQVEHFEDWSTARQYNIAFGQGLTVTPLQMAVAYSALANGGVLIEPRIVDKLIYHPSDKEVEPSVQEGRRVVSKDTANTVTAMLTSVAEVGGSKGARVDGYYIAGKTGTAQIASSRGGYEEGVGTTTGSFAGYLPADNPMFVIITKIDRPRTTQWADSSAAPLFKQIGTFLMQYYNVPPER